MSEQSPDAKRDLVRRSLEEARDAAKQQGKTVGLGRRSPTRRGGTGSVAARRERRYWSGPGLDRERDPESLSALVGDVAKSRGWSSQVAAGAVFGQWESIVGDQIAAHATPTALRDGVLNVAAESTAWATQLRLVQAQILAKIAAAVGDGVVKSVKITGPTAPSWRKGPRHVSGRGPRDTYG